MCNISVQRMRMLFAELGRFSFKQKMEALQTPLDLHKAVHPKFPFIQGGSF